MTLATGSRGASTRDIFEDPGNIPGCEGVPSPCGVVVALTALDAAYASQEAAYDDRFGGVPGFSKTFVAGTDTFARGWMQTFSDLARRYHVFILGSNNQAEFRESVDPAEIEEFADPDVENPTSAFVATGPEVYNEAFMWGPRNVTPDGPRPLRNVVASNKKVPLTDIENADQPDAGTEHRPGRDRERAAVPDPRHEGEDVVRDQPAGLRLRRRAGDAVRRGARTPASTPARTRRSTTCTASTRSGPTSSCRTRRTRGSGRRRASGSRSSGCRSTWRSSADPTVDFDYNVTPHMVGNLADLPFDGQTAITQRGLKGPRGVKPAKAKCNYVGNDRFIPARGPAALRGLRGPEARVPRTRALGSPRTARATELRDIGAALAPGSGDPRENDYLETAVVADLPYPPVAHRDNCSADPVAPMRDHRGMETGTEPLRDAHGRTISDLRVSVTDRCNFRCQYCMPADGLPWLERDEVLSFEEIERLVGLLVRLGIEDVRLTGGEPLVRREFPRLVSMLAPIPGLGDLSLTTNGYLLERDADALVDAGIGRVNVSIDSLARDRFFQITRRDALPAGPPRARGDRRPRARPPDQGQRDRDARLHRARGRLVRRARPDQRLPGPLHRVHAARRRPRLDARLGPDRRRDPRPDRALPRARRGAARALGDRPRLPLRRRRAARSASSTRSASPSAPTATASASPPRASSAPASSRSTRPTSASRSAPAPPTPSSRRSSATPSGARSSSTTSASRASARRRAR